MDITLKFVYSNMELLHRLTQQKDIEAICKIILSSKTAAQWTKTVDECRITYGYSIENYWIHNFTFEENQKIDWALSELAHPEPEARSFKK